jgi:large subunit ribosomal protein L19
MDLLKEAESAFVKDTQYPDFKAGDTITVHYKIREGNKERIQQFRGVVLQRRGSGISATFMVRKMSGNIGVERIFPISSPFIVKIEVNKRGHVRRARIFYLRERTGKKARIQERRMSAIEPGSEPSAEPAPESTGEKNQEAAS